MSNKFLAVVAIVLASMTTAGVGSYLALRERVRPATVAEAQVPATEATVPEGPLAPPAVSETEQALSGVPASEGAGTGSNAAPPARVAAASAPVVAAPTPRSPAPRSAPARSSGTARRPAVQPTASRAESVTPRSTPARAVEESAERAESTTRAGTGTGSGAPVEPDASTDPRSSVPASRQATEPVIPAPPPAPVYDELVVPADAVVGLQIDSTISTERARVEDPVSARITRDVRVDGRVAIPAGTRVQGAVTLVERGGKIKDRARLGVRFHTLVLADGTRTALATETLYREGESVSGGSAAKIGGAAVGGAIIGAILGGGKGAAIGAATGAGGGTAAAMAGDRKPATLPAGSTVTVRLSSPATVTVDRTPERDQRDQ